MNKKELLERQLKRSRSATDEHNNSIEAAKADRRGEGRAQKIQKLEALQIENKTLETELEAQKLNDPAEIKRIQVLAKQNQESANRWTDNIWGVKKFLTKKKNMSSKECDKMLKMDDEFDYVSTCVVCVCLCVFCVVSLCV